MRKIEDKKIALFMLPLLTHGAGAEKYFINMARSLSDRGVKVDIITLDRNFYKKFCFLLSFFYFRKINPLEREEEEDVKKTLGGSKWIQSSLLELRRNLKKYNIIYSKNEISDLFLLKSIGYKKLPPVIVGVHTPIFYAITSSLLSKLHNFLYVGFFYRWLINGVRCVHLSNKFTIDLVRKNFNISSKLIYYPFSSTYLADNADKYKSDIHFNNKKKNIVFIARLSEQKGIKSLVRIVEKISEKEDMLNKIQFNIFGSGEKENERLVSDLMDRYSFVKWYGHIENKYIPSILKDQDLFITTAKWETLPFNVLEAQAMGLPVVSFDIPGPNDIINDKETGFLVKSEDEFVEKISTIVLGNMFFDKNKIIENVDNKFSPNKIYAELLSMFEENL